MVLDSLCSLNVNNLSTNADDEKLTVSDNSKGQSAVEYLMTYGWMLIVIAVIGGTIFSVVQGENLESVSGFSGGDLAVDDFGLTDNGKLGMELRNTAADPVEIHSITFSQGGQEFTTGIDEKVSTGSSEPVSPLGVLEGDGTNEIDVQVTYTVGELENVSETGTVTGSLDMIDFNSPDEAELLNYSNATPKIAEYETSMEQISSSSKAMNSISNSSSAMSELANHSVSYIKDNWIKYEYNLSSSESENGPTSYDKGSPPVASIYYAEISGAGGGGADEDSDGDPGGNSSFGGAVAIGGEEGEPEDIFSNPDGVGSSGNTSEPPNPSRVVESTAGGGGDGGDSSKDGKGGAGGFIRALISNSAKSSLEASVGSGGLGANPTEEGMVAVGDIGESGEDGSVVVWVPPSQ